MTIDRNMPRLSRITIAMTVLLPPLCPLASAATVTPTPNSPPTYSVIPRVGPGGSIGPSSRQIVGYGATTTFAVAAAVGYSIDSIAGCGGKEQNATSSPIAYTTGPITADCVVVASFKLDSPPIKVTVVPSGGGSVSLRATPNEGYSFSHFSGDCSNGPSCDLININGPKVVNAHFVLNSYPINIGVSPLGAGNIICDANPAFHGSSIQCIAKPADGYLFLNFNGDCTGTTCALTNILGPKAIAGNFVKKTYPITANTAPDRGGSVVCDPSQVAHGDTTTCTCKPKDGYGFMDFSGDCTGETCVLNDVTGPKSVVCNLESPLKVLIHDVESDCQTTTAILSVLNRHNAPLTGLTPDNFVSIATDDVDLRDCKITVPKTAVRVPMVLDRSGSMKGSPMTSLKAAAKQFINNLSDADQAAVFSFASEVKRDQNWTADKVLLSRTIDNLEASGNTALFWAVDAATAYAAKVQEGRVSVVVMADGDNNVDKVSEAELEKNLKSRGLPVYTIGLGNIQGRALQNIAALTNAAYYKAASPAELGAIYQRISSVLGSQYEISCTARTCNNDIHTLKVNVKTTDAFGIGTRKYYSKIPAAVPTAITKPASAITATGAVLNGLINDNGADTAVTFDFDPVTTCLEPGYSLGSVATPGTVKANSGETAVILPINGLFVCDRAYHFRVKAVNSVGAGYGQDESFKTLPCAPTSFTVTPMINKGGTVNPAPVQQVAAGAKQDFTLTPDTGYMRDAKVGGTCPLGSWNDNVWTTGPINADCSVLFGFTCTSKDNCQ